MGCWLVVFYCSESSGMSHADFRAAMDAQDGKNDNGVNSKGVNNNLIIQDADQVNHHSHYIAIGWLFVLIVALVVLALALWYCLRKWKKNVQERLLQRQLNNHTVAAVAHGIPLLPKVMNVPPPNFTMNTPCV